MSGQSIINKNNSFKITEDFSYIEAK